MKINRRITNGYFNHALKKYEKLIYLLCYRVGENQHQIEELKSQGVVELLKCLICYDGRAAFSTFLYSRLFGVFRHMRDYDRRPKRIGLVSLDTIMDLSETNEDFDTSMSAEEGLSCLNDEERDVITQLFWDHKTMRDIAEDNGTAPSTVFHAKHRALDRMRQHFLIR